MRRNVAEEDLDTGVYLFRQLSGKFALDLQGLLHEIRIILQ